MKTMALNDFLKLKKTRPQLSLYFALHCKQWECWLLVGKELTVERNKILVILHKQINEILWETKTFMISVLVVSEVVGGCLHVYFSCLW
jgi:hypothetical protein